MWCRQVAVELSGCSSWVSAARQRGLALVLLALFQPRLPWQVSDTCSWTSRPHRAPDYPFAAGATEGLQWCCPPERWLAVLDVVIDNATPSELAESKQGRPWCILAGERRFCGCCRVRVRGILRPQWRLLPMLMVWACALHNAFGVVSGRAVDGWQCPCKVSRCCDS